MNYITKRQKFASEQRQKHREEIFKKHRASYVEGQEYGGERGRDGEFLYGEIIGRVDWSGDRIMEIVNNGELEKILQPMPKWILSLSNQIPPQSQQNPTKILHFLLSISLPCLTTNKLVPQVTACLAQLTSLPTGFLSWIQISQQKLARQLIPIVYKILVASSNMQVIFNCVYICGNLYQASRQGSKGSKGRGNWDGIESEEEDKKERENQQWVYEIEMGVISKMQEICTLYPNYENSLQVLLWYMKNCIIISKTSKTPNTYHLILNLTLTVTLSTKRFLTYISVLHKIILFLCTKYSNTLGNSQNLYYVKVLKLGYYLMHIVVGESGLYYQGDANGKEMRKELPEMLEQVDQSILAYLTILFPSPSSHSSQKPPHLLPILPLISQTLSQILQNLPHLPLHNLIPKSLIQICQLASEGSIKCAESVALCREILELIFGPNGRNGRNGGNGRNLGKDWEEIGVGFVGNVLGNVGRIFGEKEVVVDREYRIEVMKMFECIQDTLPPTKIHKILTNLPHHFPHSLPTATSPPIHHLHHILPPILNLTNLLLIDQDTQIRSLGIKIIYKLSINWEINTKMLRNLVISMGIADRVLDMQGEKDQAVYGVALDLIEELGLDQDYDQDWQ